MIKIAQTATQLFLKYTPDGYTNTDAGWIDAELGKGSVTLKHTFTFSQSNLLQVVDSVIGEENVRTFILGVVDGDYYKINATVLDIKHDLRLFNKMKLSPQTFVAYQGISIFRKIDSLITEAIAIPLQDFDKLLKNFPNSTELKHYANARVSSVLKDYLETTTDAEKKLNAYLNRKRTVEPKSRVFALQANELAKYEYMRDTLQKMLVDANTYSENDWQKLIVDFLLLLFPKYIAVLENLHVKDFYSNQKKVTTRKIDLTLVDANGSIDIVEIKKPFADCLLSSGTYRDNHTPRRELSGCVMQAEKYLFHLNKWGREGEKEILKKHSSKLPANFEIKITNPQAMLVLGRDTDFTADQKFDFEIIKRKYANMMDIMTYDDLLRRLENMIAMLQRKAQAIA